MVQKSGGSSATANFATCRHIAYNLTEAPGKDFHPTTPQNRGLGRRISRQPHRSLISFTRFPCS